MSASANDTANDTGFIYGHEVLSLLERMGGASTREELRRAAAEAFGAGALFGNCHGDRFEFDGLMAFLHSAGKLSLEGSRVRLGHVPACSGH